MWVQWVHINCRKQGTVRRAQPKQALWIVQKIMKAGKYYEELGWREDKVQRIKKFFIKEIYLKLRGEFQKLDWMRLVCNSAVSPKWILNLYLATWGRLLTKERLEK